VDVPEDHAVLVGRRVGRSTSIFAVFRACASAGSRIATSSAMIAITTSSSINVNARWSRPPSFSTLRMIMLRSP
jgi:hypothetical protein